MSQDFRKLKMWQRAHGLSLYTRRVASRFQTREPDFASQLTRSASSIPANIAEGRGASSDREYSRYLGIAQKSRSEFENHVEEGFGATLLREEERAHMIDEADQIRRIIIAYRKTLGG